MHASYDYWTPNLNDRFLFQTGKVLNRDNSSNFPLTMTTDERNSIDPFLDTLTLNFPKSDWCVKIGSSGLNIISLYNEIIEVWRSVFEDV